MVKELLTIVTALALVVVLVLAGIALLQPPPAAAAPGSAGEYIQYTSARLEVVDGEVRGYWPPSGDYQPLNAWGSQCWQLVAVTRTAGGEDYAVFSRPFGAECNGGK